MTVSKKEIRAMADDLFVAPEIDPFRKKTEWIENEQLKLDRWRLQYAIEEEVRQTIFWQKDAARAREEKFWREWYLHPVACIKRYFRIA